MARLQELNFAEFAFLVEFPQVKKLAGIDHGFHHHVFLLPLPDQGYDLFAVLDAGRHRHGAGDVLARLERRDGLPGVIGNRRVDVDRVHLRVLDQFIEIVVPFLHPECVADCIQFLARALADRVHVRLGMALVDGDEFGTKAQPDDGDVNLSRAHASVMSVDAPDCKDSRSKGFR